MDNKIIYLDYNATTPVAREVAGTMKPWLDEMFGNPSSHYSYGVEAKKAVETARKQVADLINASPDEIIFTSGGTEANNFAIKGMAYALKHKGNHIITSAIEHPAVLEVTSWLSKQGFEITLLPVAGNGQVLASDFEKAIRPDTILASVMHSNNETGILQPVKELAAIARSRGIAFHTDAAQSIAKVSVDVRNLGVDMLSLAGHKLYAPKGIGALYIKTGIIPEKIIHGASQERDFRAGTENVLEIVGLGKACEMAALNLDHYMSHFRHNRNLLLELLLSEIADIRVNTEIENSLPNTLSVSFRNVHAETMLAELKGIAASAGAACHPAGQTVSHVLEAMKVPEDYAFGTIRFSVGRNTAEEDIRSAAALIIETYRKLNPGESAAGFPEPLTDGIRLTQYTHGLGCACKIRPAKLEEMLEKMQKFSHSDLLVGTETSDDAAVYKISDTEALVQTVDFFTPIVDDPYKFGAIAAANALSDIYAMGADPLFALNLVGFPIGRLPESVLHQILQGASDKMQEAGVIIAGGHSIESSEPIFGMTVSGRVRIDKIWRNKGIQPGDVLIITKPLGTGIISTALKNGMADAKAAKKAEESMMQINKTAAEVFKKYKIHACTDVTGFGLIGHLSEMVLSSKVEVNVFASQIPVFAGVDELIMQGAVPGGTKGNLDHFSKHVNWSEEIAQKIKIIVSDAQTSGGLLAAIPEEYADKVLIELKNKGLSHVCIIGKCIGNQKSVINFYNSPL